MHNRRVNFSNAILLGGSFDPVHRGHLDIARFVADRIEAARVILMPTARNPLKHPPIATDAQRLAMLEIAAAGDSLFAVSDLELRRGARYTIDTVEMLLAEGVSELTLLVGADNLRDLPRWRRVEELLSKVRLIVACRPPDGFADAQAAVDALAGQLPTELVASVRAGLLETPLIDISSTAIREAASRGESCEAMLPPGVWDYIQAEGLYR